MRISGIICLLLFVLKAYPQQKEFVFKHFTRDDRLASNRVNFVTKDHHGFIWFATAYGLQHYDGKMMVSFMHADGDSTSLPDNSTGLLLEDKKGRMWVSTGKGIGIYDARHYKFSQIKIDYEPSFGYYAALSLTQDYENNIWLSLNPGGLFIYDSVSNSFKPYTTVWAKCPHTIFRISKDKWTGNYWVGTDSGLLLYDIHTREYYSNSYNPKGLNCFKNPNFSIFNILMNMNPDGDLWLMFWGNGEPQHNYKYNTRTDTYEDVGTLLGNVFNFFTDATGTTWAYGDVLSMYDKTLKKFVAIPKKRNDRFGIDFNEMYNLFEDDEHNLWASTDMGVFVFNPLMQKFNTVTVQSFTRNQIIDGNINGIMQASDGTVIAIGWGVDGLYFYDSLFNRIHDRYGFNPKAVPDINYILAWCGMQDSKGIIWIGCQSGRIILLDPKTNIPKFIYRPEFVDRTIRSIMEDKYGNIWFGTQNNIVVKWERKTNQFIQIISKPYSNFVNIVTALLEGNHDDIWVGMGITGLYRIDIKDGKILEHYELDRKNPKGIQSSSILALSKGNGDTIVMATNKGIALMDTRTKEFKHITEADGLPSNYILSMVKDDENNFWFTTYNGLWKIHLPDLKIAAYGSKEGVTEATFYVASATKLLHGSMAFGGVRGFVYFHPDQVREKAVPPDVRITGFQIFNYYTPVDSLFQYGNKINLDYTQNYINIRFSTMSYLLNDRLEYYYKLEGADKDWVKAGPTREANYTYLPGGNYTFMVKAVSYEGATSKNITSFTIYIKPPFWERWWFYLLGILAVGGIVYGIYRVRINRLIDMEKVRRRIARDLHDDMGSTLSTINILSEMAKMKIDSDKPSTKTYLTKISDNSSRMMEAMDDIVWSINPVNDNMQKITARMREFAANVLEAKNIEYSFKVDEEVKDIKLNMEERRDFFLIFKEAINNLAKYSNCKHANIEISIRRSKLQMKIQDDGTGFDVNDSDNGNGLINMKKRARSMRGNLSIESATSVGTKIQLEVPVG